MEGLQGEHLNHFFYEEHLSLECLDQDATEERCNNGAVDYNTYQSSMSIHQVPFLHMLQEPSSFQFLLRLQEEQLLPRHPSWVSKGKNCTAENYCFRPPLPSSFELDSCVTHVSETHSEGRNQPNNLPGATCCDRETGTVATAAAQPAAQVFVGEKDRETSEKKRRRRCRILKKTEETESQRMSHIAVERNRRRLMNDHLAALRALMPKSYIQRGDQASIVGGAIDFVKELEQHLQSLEAMKVTGAARSRADTSTPRPLNEFFVSPQYSTYKDPCSSAPFHSQASYASGTVKVEEDMHAGACGEGSVQTSAVADIEATVVQTHVNLRVLARRRPGQLLRAISAMEELRLSVLHLNVTSFHDSVLYSLNLRIEEECKLGSADEIATAVHQIFAHLSSTCL